jgi:hypothetical protein
METCESSGISGIFLLIIVSAIQTSTLFGGVVYVHGFLSPVQGMFPPSFLMSAYDGQRLLWETEWDRRSLPTKLKVYRAFVLQTLL